MQVISNERVIFFDVDKTLVLSCKSKYSNGSIQVKDPYDGALVMRDPHKPHIKLLKNYHARGAHIFVWSKNGVRWAQSVIEALELEKYVHHVLTKPFGIVDDESPEKWIGEQIYIPPDADFGNEGF